MRTFIAWFQPITHSAIGQYHPSSSTKFIITCADGLEFEPFHGVELWNGDTPPLVTVTSTTTQDRSLNVQYTGLTHCIARHTYHTMWLERKERWLVRKHGSAAQHCFNLWLLSSGMLSIVRTKHTHHRESDLKRVIRLSGTLISRTKSGVDKGVRDIESLL